MPQWLMYLLLFVAGWFASKLVAGRKSAAG